MTPITSLVALSILAGKAALLAAPDPGMFDTGKENQAGLVFSPDGNSAYWVAWNGVWGGQAASVRTIYTSKLENGVWGGPSVMPFSGRFNDDDPFVSPDGQWLYFVSERPLHDGGIAVAGDIWRYSLVRSDVLERLDINSEAAEFSPVITAAGNLYFSSARAGGPGKGDLYCATAGVIGFNQPEPLGSAMNTVTGEWNLWVSADEKEVLFEASARPSNVSVPGDLYYSHLTPSGWTAAMPVSSLNGDASDLLPRLHPDGRTLYYTSAPIGGHAGIRSADWHSIRAELRESYAPTLLVANRSSHEIAFIDLFNAKVTDRVATGKGPHLLSNVELDRVVATGFGEFPRPHAEPVDERPPFEVALNSRLSVIDVRSRTVVMDTRIEACTRPHASWIVDNRGFVTCQDEKIVAEIDLKTGNVIGRFPTEQDGTHVLNFDENSRTLAASNTQSASMTLINIDSGETRIINLASGSEGLDQIAGHFWVANAWDGSVSIVDPNSAEVLAQSNSLCGFPIALSPDRRHQVWVACFGSSELVAIDRDTYDVTRRFSLNGQPLNLLVHPDRDVAYASMPRENAIAEIDLNSEETVRLIRTGIEPDGLRWATSREDERTGMDAPGDIIEIVTEYPGLPP